ncbi:hypothetical protein WOLCODRAFT_150530 [Wolfiporia cocos MD-104 SS10]|uniref:Geranylgeranyl pyrophosphate synthetase n=1 Tax=Wolfiporia cocos (strain MD-104) TaxID=742152 RepID=A0A2H3JRU6_WOLCO|nr:hypothetical protein WOLCODRAFT_150530 [Wolfiporia cocos MD-104 SS10]
MRVGRGLRKAPVATLPLPTLLPESLTSERIQPRNAQLLGSYNWLEARKATMLVPGVPPRWRDPEGPYQILRDRGVYCVEQNAHRLPHSPLLPAMYAVDITSKLTEQKVDWSTVDFVIDRNTLRDFLQWIAKQDTAKFRIDTQLAGERTVLCTRRTVHNKVKIDSMRDGSYKHSFARASAIRDPRFAEEKSASHHRIIKYDYDGLNMVVIYEAGAYTRWPGVRNMIMPDSSPSATAHKSQGNKVKGHLSVIFGGVLVSEDYIAELACCATDTTKELVWKDRYPHMFLSQTPTLLCGVHSSGTVKFVIRRALDDPDMQKADAELQSDFKKLRLLLSDIQRMVIQHGKQGRLSFAYEKGNLRVYDRIDQTNCLPSEVMARFDSRDKL